jgi:hypothetical protein
MHLTSTLRRTLGIGGASLLAVVALIGWTRHDSAPPAQPAINAADEFGQPYGASVSYPASSPAPNGQIVYGASPFGPDTPMTAAPPPPVAAVVPEVAPAVYAGPPVATQRVVVQRRYYTTRRGRRRYVVVRRRKFSHSAAIVGGSAAGGALIGGLAGGGKGAAIGALVGGGGGLVYDRLTHKKRVVVRR